MSTRGLIGYAVLRANFNYDEPSYVDNFSRYVLHVLALRHPTHLSVHDAAADVRETFGFTIPDNVVSTLLKRAAKKGLVTRGKSDKGSYGLDAIQLSKIPDVSADVAQFERQQKEVVAKFCDFVSGYAPEHLSLIEDDPSEHLNHYVERHAAPLLARALRGSDRAHDTHEFTGADFLVNAFASHLGDTDSAAFGYLVDLVKGAILAAVVELGTGNLDQRLDGVTLIFDTPVVLKALGYLGSAQQEAARQTLDLAKELQAGLRCFPHTIKEVDGVLDSVKHVLRTRGARSGALREVDAYFLDQGATAADIEIEQGNLVNNIRRLGIREIDPPDNHYKFGLDEAALDQLLQDVVHYRSDATRRYDVESLSAVHRLRRGSAPREFERCKHVLVTDNERLYRAAHRVDERHDWPLAMLDTDLAALLWVRKPAVHEDLPRTQLLATVYSGMQPGGHLWAKYLDEIERLIGSGDVNEDDALLLRARPEARAALMVETLGADVVDEDSINAVLNRVRGQLQEPIRQRLASAELARDAAVQAAAVAKSEGEEQRQHSENLSEELAEVQRQLTDIQAEKATQGLRIRKRAETRAGHIVGAVMYSLGTVCIGGAGVRFIAPDWLDRVPAALGVALVVAAVVIFGVGAWQHFAGGSVREWARRAETPLANRLERRYRRQAGLPDSPADPPTLAA